MKEVFTDKTFTELCGKEVEKNLLITIGYVYDCGDAFKTIDEIVEYFNTNGEAGIQEMAAEIRKKYDAQEKAITLTKGQWSTLTCYLCMSTHHRTDEAAAWHRLAEKKDEDGKPEYKNAASNAEFWDETVEKIEEIIKRIDEQ